MDTFRPTSNSNEKLKTRLQDEIPCHKLKWRIRTYKNKEKNLITLHLPHLKNFIIKIYILNTQIKKFIFIFIN